MTSAPPPPRATGWKFIGLLVGAALVVAFAMSGLQESGAPTTTSVATSPAVTPAGAPHRARSHDPVTPPPASGHAGKFDAECAQVLAGQTQALASVGAVDATTGDSVTWASPQFGAQLPVYSASIAKVDIAEAFLLTKGDQGQLLTTRDSALMSAMIIHSDNDAADALYSQLGGAAALGELNRRLGLTGTGLHSDGQWGLNTTTVADQLMLLQNLGPGGALSTNAKTYLTGLMSQVDAGLRWGASVVGSDPALKTGDLPLGDSGDDDWVVNSVGFVTAPNGHQLRIVVLSNGWDTLEDGTRANDALALAAARALAGT